MRPSSDLYAFNPSKTPCFGPKFNPKMQTLDYKQILLEADITD